MDEMNELARAVKGGRLTRREFFSLSAKMGVSAAVASSLVVPASLLTPLAVPAKAADKKLLMGFTNLLKSNEFCATVETSCAEAAAKEGWDFYTLDNDLDANKALANADAMVTKKVDFVWSFQAIESINPAIHDKYVEAGIPHISIDSSMPETVRFGANNWAAGKMCGTWLAEYAKNNWGGTVDGVVATWVSSWDAVVMQRLNGVIYTIKEVFPEWNDETISRLDVILDAEKGEAGFRAWLNAHPDAHHILISTMTNDLDGLSALAALQATGREQDAVICAGGCDPTAVAELKKPDNAFKGSVAFFPERYGEYLVPITKDLLAGNPVKPSYSPDHLVVTRDNVSQYYA